MGDILGLPEDILGLPELDYEVTLMVKNKRTGAENKIWLPNVGSVATENYLTRKAEGMASYAQNGMPQVMVVIVGFNASPRSGQSMTFVDGGAMGKKDGNDGEATSE